MPSKIREAVARGWCHSKNAHKDMDVDLAEAIVEEVLRVTRTDTSTNKDLFKPSLWGENAE